MFSFKRPTETSDVTTFIDLSVRNLSGVQELALAFSRISSIILADVLRQAYLISCSSVSHLTLKAGYVFSSLTKESLDLIKKKKAKIT